MTTGLQLSLLAGGLVGLGLVLIVARLLPVQPDLADALERLSASAHRPESAATRTPQSRLERLGLWAARVLPAGAWVRTPRRELDLLGIPVGRFYGEKLAFAGLGLVMPSVVTLFADYLGLGFPLVLPALVSPAAAVVLSFVPNYNAVDDARRARLELTRALSAYIELVALERDNGSGPRQAMEIAAAVGSSGSWVFRRTSEELNRSRWSGLPPWDALRTLATELGLPELEDLSDIMRLSGEDGASVYTTLRARAAAMRTALLNKELADANATGERMTLPATLPFLVFLALLIAPMVTRMITPT